MSARTLRTRKLRSAAAALVAVLCIALAQPASAGRTSEAVVGTTAALVNLVYGPLKITYALVGGLIGGSLAYALSAGDAEVASRLFDAGFRGDYAVTPEHLRRERDLEFIGFSEEHRRARERAGQGGVNEW